MSKKALDDVIWYFDQKAKRKNSYLNWLRCLTNREMIEIADPKILEWEKYKKWEKKEDAIYKKMWEECRKNKTKILTKQLVKQIDDKIQKCWEEGRDLLIEWRKGYIIKN